MRVEINLCVSEANIYIDNDERLNLIIHLKDFCTIPFMPEVEI